MLELDALHVKIGDQWLARDVSLHLQPGHLNMVIGPNGTGKSSLLRAIFSEMAVLSGDIRLDGHRQKHTGQAKWRSMFGYMPQDIHLDAALSVLEVVLLGQLDRLALRQNDELVLKAARALDDVGLLHLADRDVRTLSGGQKQLALFAQAVLRTPRMLMLDEPVSALDLHHQMVLLDHLAAQTHARQWITLVVLHDLNLAAQYADRLIVLNQGKIQAMGDPRSILTQSLIEDVYGVKAEVLHDNQGYPFVRTLRHRPTQALSTLAAPA